MMFEQYDVIVVGGGHAGCEAACAAANMGARVLLITMQIQSIGQMSCNPAMGGIAKGQIIREIDALGGFSGIVADRSTIHFRMLNQSKGPAVWSPRSQNDRALFASVWQEVLFAQPNIDLYQDMVSALLLEAHKVSGVCTARGHKIYARSVVLTNGTFLNGAIYIGEKKSSGGRMAERAATGLTEQLQALGFSTGRLKTGTPPRLDGRTIDYGVMEAQPPDKIAGQGFSFLPVPKIPLERHLSCHITYTNEEVHNILRSGFATSPMFNGSISGVGPRYCPSIEDKIHRFSQRDRHQLFIEPEGLHTVEVYLNGFSTSLDEAVQVRALRKIRGLERVKIFKPGYAIEYDYFPPIQLRATLETKAVGGLFFAGQINGTTGYEEAAGQGLIAGINAVLGHRVQPPFVLARDEAYIGVLIDDLVTKGTEEPYRMFTSRAEFRTLLRQDNADLRLTEKSFKIGLADETRYTALKNKAQKVSRLTERLQKDTVSPERIASFLTLKNSAPIVQRCSLAQLLLRTEVHLPELLAFLEYGEMREDRVVLEQAEIQIKYAQYIEKEKEMSEKINRFLSAEIPLHFDYDRVQGLGAEARDKLRKMQPRTLRQAHQISGITPADIQTLLIYMGR